MVEGRLRKFYEEVVLLQQAFVHDPEQTVAKALEAAGRRPARRSRSQVSIGFALGEGIDRAETDFAAEVAAAVSQS